MRKIIKHHEVNNFGRLQSIQADQKNGCYFEILDALNREMTAMLAHHNKLFFVRIDMRVIDYSDKNKMVSDLLRKIKRWIAHHYQTKHIGHLWVREVERAKKQHYHLVLMVDGNKMNHPKRLIQRIEEMAEQRNLPKPYTPDNCFIMINRGDNTAFDDAFYRGSYLAKTRGKNYKGKLANNFSASRIKQPNKT